MFLLHFDIRLTVCTSVRLSVTLVDCDHKVWLKCCYASPRYCVKTCFNKKAVLSQRWPTAQCALYMGALKIFGTPWDPDYAHGYFSQNFMGFCSDGIPSDRALVSFYRPSIVTFPLSSRVSEILPLLFSSVPLFPYHISSLHKFSPFSLGVGGSPFGYKERRWWANCPCN